MTTIRKSALVPYTAEQMYALVDDINAYSEFLPWCRTSEELSRTDEEVRASIEIAYSGLHKSFTTVNRLQHAKMIEMRLVEGPFKHLEGYWRFDGLGEEGCRVSLDLEFEFASKFLGMTVGPLFTQIANNLVDAFIKRAKQIHG